MKRLLSLIFITSVLSNPPITKHVFMDITIDSQPVGRIVIGLYARALPKTSENFRALCTGENGYDFYGTRLSYENSTFHYISVGGMLIGGDITSGTGITSIYGKEFPSESFLINHDKPGIVGMFSLGHNTNGCQFYITLEKYKHMDGRLVAFGEVTEGMEVVRSIEKVGIRDPRPGDRVVIRKCGEV